jgi:hypothetical protein
MPVNARLPGAPSQRPQRAWPGPVTAAISLGVPRDLYPHVSEGGLEPFAYITAAGTDPWLSV